MHARSLEGLPSASVHEYLFAFRSLEQKYNFPFLVSLARSLARSMDLRIRLVVYVERRLRRVSISLSGMTSLCHVFLDVRPLPLFFGPFSLTEWAKWTCPGNEADDSISVSSPCGVSSSPSSAPPDDNNVTFPTLSHHQEVASRAFGRSRQPRYGQSRNIS